MQWGMETDTYQFDFNGQPVTVWAESIGVMIEGGAQPSNAAWVYEYHGRRHVFCAAYLEDDPDEIADRILADLEGKLAA